MEKNNINLSEKAQLYYKELITERFVHNPRMSLLFDNGKKRFKRNIFNLVDYCFSIALKLGGIFIAKNKKTIVLYYEKKKFKKGIVDHFKYLKMVKGIPLFKLKKIFQNEQKIKKHRLKLENFIYVWFIAQKEGYGKLDGLIEINKMLKQIASKSKLPILFETSDYKLLDLYHRAGFKVYSQLKNQGRTFYFLSNWSSNELDGK